MHPHPSVGVTALTVDALDWTNSGQQVKGMLQTSLSVVSVTAVGRLKVLFTLHVCILMVGLHVLSILYVLSPCGDSGHMSHVIAGLWLVGTRPGSQATPQRSAAADGQSAHLPEL